LPAVNYAAGMCERPGHYYCHISKMLMMHHVGVDPRDSLQAGCHMQTRGTAAVLQLGMCLLGDTAAVLAVLAG
jgi:hypothetical protein